MNCLEDRIKWRGKCINNKDWIYGTLTSLGKNIGNINIFTFVIKNTLGQYTGYKDKNGKEIYEGDILKKNSFKKLVVFNEDKMQLQLVYPPNNSINLFSEFGDKKNGISYEVIGNIYDNPELINYEL